MSATRVLPAVRLSVEVVAVGLVAAWGLHAVSGPTGWLVAVAASAALIMAWGRYVAPKSPARLDDPARLAVEVGLLGAAAFASAPTVSPTFAAGFGAIAIGDAIMLRITESRPRSTTDSRPAVHQERP